MPTSTPACRCDAEAREIVSQVGTGKEQSIPLLQEIQRRHGYLPADLVRAVSRVAKLSESELFGVATFYSQFRFTPRGKHAIKVCVGTACHVAGSPAVVDALCDDLKIKPGQTTPDGGFSIETVACLGCCSLAPVLTVNKETIGNVDPLQAPRILMKVSTCGTG